MIDMFKTKRGDLTAYALACGYVEREEINNVRVALFHEGGPHYHVRAYNLDTGSLIFWKSSSKLTKCRQWFRQYVKHLKEVHDGASSKRIYTNRRLS